MRIDKFQADTILQALKLRLSDWNNNAGCSIVGLATVNGRRQFSAADGLVFPRAIEEAKRFEFAESLDFDSSHIDASNHSLHFILEPPSFKLRKQLARNSFFRSKVLNVLLVNIDRFSNQAFPSVLPAGIAFSDLSNSNFTPPEIAESLFGQTHTGHNNQSINNLNVTIDQSNKSISKNERSRDEKNQESQNHRHRQLLATYDDHPVGCCSMSLLSAELRCAVVHDLFVKSGFRKTGIGTQLLFKTLNECGANAYESATLLCEETMLPFYRKFGFEAIGKLECWSRDHG